MKTTTPAGVILLFFLFILPFMPSAAAQDALPGRGVIYVKVRSSAGAPPKATPFYQESHALLIANSTYKHWRDLPSIPQEMEAVKDALTGHGFQIFRGRVLQNLDSKAMLAAYRDFVDEHGFDPDNRLVLYFAGHGYTRGRDAGAKGYIVPVDAPSPTADDRGFARAAIEMTFIDGLMNRIESRHALFLFDSCFSGSILGTRGDDAKIPAYISAAQREPVRYYITAGSADEEVPAVSTFTPAFSRALTHGAADADGDGFTLGSELAQYLRKQVALHSRPATTVHRGTVRNYRLSQGDMVFVTPKGSGLAQVTPRTATKERPFVNSLGMKFVPVPGTDVLFCIWETRVRDFAAYAKDVPGVDDEWKDFEYEGHKQGPDDPVVNVSWEDAKAFCEWLSGKEGLRYRLPTDHEWSVAVGIGSREDASASPEDKGGGEVAGIYPWGTAWPPPKSAGNYNGYDPFPFTVPVESFLANNLGLHCLGGNVWEWCQNWFDSDKSHRVVRGGSFYDRDEISLMSSFRARDIPTIRHAFFGFRCVLEVKSLAFDAGKSSAGDRSVASP